jgi:hypothetical protein
LRASRACRSAYLAKNHLQDLSIGKRGEDFEAAYAADMAELRKMNR